MMETAEVYADILYRKRIHFSMLLDRAATADDDDGVHNIIYYYNDSKTHSKMDINYRGFSFPPSYTATAGRISRTFWAFWCTSRICQTGRRWRVFQPSKKKEHNHTQNTLYAYIYIHTQGHSKVLFHFFFIFFFIFILFKRCKTIGNTKNVIWN